MFCSLLRKLNFWAIERTCCWKLNLKVGKKESQGNKAARLAKELMKREMEKQHKEIFEVFGGNLANWLLTLFNTNSENSMVRQSQCGNYLAVGQSPENKTE